VKSSSRGRLRKRLQHLDDVETGQQPVVVGRANTASPEPRDAAWETIRLVAGANMEMWRLTFHRAMLENASVAPEDSADRSLCAIA